MTLAAVVEEAMRNRRSKWVAMADYIDFII
jgi:hypothetical protein